MPKLGYASALGLITLWGLIFVVVLTMISGARELLTPGAWKPQGWTYALDSTAPVPATTPLPDAQAADRVREQKLNVLRAALWQYAESHDGTFPPNRETAGVVDAAWETTDLSGLRYAYHAGLKPDQMPERAVAHEPGTVGDERFVLLTSGAISKMPLTELRKLQPE